MDFEWERRKGCLRSPRRAIRFSAALILISIVAACSAALPIAIVKAENLTFEKTWGGTDSERGYAVARDPSGNIYITGYTKSFGAGDLDVFLLKYDSSGTLQWQKTWDGRGADEEAYAVAVDSSSNIYITGRTYGFGTVCAYVFLLKYDSSGTLQWQKTWGGTGCNYGYGIAVDSSSNIYITGTTDSFGAGDHDVLLLKYDSSGTLQWQKRWGDTGVDEGMAVAVDSSSNIYITGYTDSFGAGLLDALLLKYDSSGNLKWQKTWGGGSDDDCMAIAMDASGNIYITGETESFGAGLWDVLLLKYDSSGTLQWQKTWGGGSDDDCMAIAMDASGNIYITGETESFGAGWFDVLLLKYDSSGNIQWQKTYGGAGSDGGYAVAVDSSSNIYITGTTDSFGAGDHDVLLLKYDSSGTLQWQKRWGDTGDDIGYGVAVGSSYFIGRTSSASRTLSDVSGTQKDVTTATAQDVTGTQNDVTGTEKDVTGIQEDVSGSETYAGQDDVFLFTPLPAPAPKPVGGYLRPVSKLELLAPYIALLGLVGAVTAICLRRRRNS